MAFFWPAFVFAAGIHSDKLMWHSDIPKNPTRNEHMFFVILLAGMDGTQTHDAVLTNQLAHGEKHAFVYLSNLADEALNIVK